MKKFKFDIILIISIALLLGAWLVFWIVSSNNTKSKYAVVAHDGNEILKIDLSIDNTYKLHDLPDGGHLEYKMIVIVENGKIKVKESECPNHDCIQKGFIQNIGDVIVCLPNKVTIKVVKS